MRLLLNIKYRTGALLAIRRVKTNTGPVLYCYDKSQVFFRKTWKTWDGAHKRINFTLPAWDLVL